jgi:hypothetical protein
MSDVEVKNLELISIIGFDGTYCKFDPVALFVLLLLHIFS